jgi:hypothetical protein
MGIGIGAAIIGGAVVGAGGSILSGMFSSNAAGKQAAAIRYQAELARQTALELDDKQRKDLQPYMNYGVKAGDTLIGMLTGGTDVGSVLNASPGYQWAETEGIRMLNRQLTARGQWGTGAGMETLARFAGQLTSDFESKFYDRLYNLTTLGANAGARAATNTVQTGNQLIGTQAQLGAAQAQAIGQQYGAWANTASQIGSLGNMVAGLPMYTAAVNNLNRMNGGAAAGGGSRTIDFYGGGYNPAQFGQESLAIAG